MVASHAQLYLFVQTVSLKCRVALKRDVQRNMEVAFKTAFLSFSLCVSVYPFTLTHLVGNSSTRETACCYITVIVPPTLTEPKNRSYITIVVLYPSWLRSYVLV